jgi:hypothetical protein
VQPIWERFFLTLILEVDVLGFFPCTGKLFWFPFLIIENTYKYYRIIVFSANQLDSCMSFTQIGPLSSYDNFSKIFRKPQEGSALLCTLLSLFTCRLGGVMMDSFVWGSITHWKNIVFRHKVEGKLMDRLFLWSKKKIWEPSEIRLF